MSPVALAINSALLHFLWQGAVVAVVLRLALATLEHRSANARYLASGAALVVLALSPVVTVLFLLLRPDTSLMNGALVSGATHAVHAFAASQASSIALFERWTLPLWSFGAGLCSLRFLRGYSTVESLRASGAPAELPLVSMVRRLQARMGVTGSVRVMLSAAIDGPSVIGWLRPVVLIPAATVLGLTSEQLEMILAHELAHIRRHDYLVNLIQMGVETVLFYHPAVWWVSARMREERELCCDDVVVRLLGHRLTYARALTALERLRLNAPTLALASTDGSLSYRVQRLLEVSPSSSHPMKLPTLLIVCLALACAAPVIDSPKAKASADQAAAEGAREAGSAASRDARALIAGDHLNPVEGGDSTGFRSSHVVVGPNGEVTRLVTMEAKGRTDVAGLRLASIQYVGVSEAIRNRIRLPFDLGSTLASDSPSQIEQALAKIDTGLAMKVGSIGNGKAALLILGGEHRTSATSMTKDGQTVTTNAAPAGDSKRGIGGTPLPINPDQALFDYQVEQQVKAAPGTTAPAYPAQLRMANIEGNTTVQFVVDTSGQADMITFKEVAASNPLFTEAVRQHLADMRFIPAEVGGRKVKQLVRMPFVFSLSK